MLCKGDKRGWAKKAHFSNEGDIRTASHAHVLLRVVGEFFCQGLQEFTPVACRYDVIWVQVSACPSPIGRLIANSDGFLFFFLCCCSGCLAISSTTTLWHCFKFVQIGLLRCMYHRLTASQRLKKGLKPKGVIVVKENNSREPFVFDCIDHSVTRCVVCVRRQGASLRGSVAVCACVRTCVRASKSFPPCLCTACFNVCLLTF